MHFRHPVALVRHGVAFVFLGNASSRCSDQLVVIVNLASILYRNRLSLSGQGSSSGHRVTYNSNKQCWQRTTPFIQIMTISTCVCSISFWVQSIVRDGWSGSDGMMIINLMLMMINMLMDAINIMDMMNRMRHITTMAIHVGTVAYFTEFLLKCHITC